MKKLFGITTAMVTPLHENEDVNLEETEKLTNFLIEKGVDCLFPLGTTGEMFKLTLDERKKIAEKVIQTTDKRVNVFIHVGAMTTKDTLELAHHALEAGADGIGAVSPSFFNANDEEIKEYYTQIAKSLPSNFPIYLYNIPQCSGNDLSFEVVKELAEGFTNIVGIKYSYPDFIKLKDYLSIQPGEFSVLTGADTLLLPALAMGCDGVVSGVSGVYPEPFVEIKQHYYNGRITKAQEMQKHANQIIEILKAGANMSYFKKALELRGILAGSMRSPQMNLSVETMKTMEQEINEWNIHKKLYTNS
ncbi:dihydrodipicolinate synthase family protein [Halobacillus sp. Marseille-P3879]|uniref:dihydrodipicolinate synthase family protein n=1 Tax=Halobacillus sp. Marseille-P3879 TaxID=2045014 RepID=UPI000C7B44E8|nr:dihydrodipicolinate synthase family protein [Halobacillus sp. Marseille-P3879]